MIDELLGSCKKNWFAFVAGLSVFITFLFYIFLSSHIDFHPDEEIYFLGTVVNLRNDTGLVFNLFYNLSGFLNSPELARVASAFIAALGLLGFLLFLRQQKLLNSPFKVFLTAAVFIVSYQAIFVFVRVRPEASWWFLIPWICWALAAVERKDEIRRIVVLFCLLLVFPMNHRLVWFVCAFIGLYGVIFYLLRNRVKLFILLCLAMVLGVLLNLVIRGIICGNSFSLMMQVFLATMPGAKIGFTDFFRLVFIDASFGLNDIAIYKNLFENLFNSQSPLLSHSFIQTSLWLTMVFLPFCGRSLKEKFVLCFPLFVYLSFWLTGYYNPTYSAGFSLVCVLAWLYLYLSSRKRRKYLYLFFVVISLVNGASFITTRVLNHGEATYFPTYQKISEMLKSKGDGITVALPERFSHAGDVGANNKVYVDYKDKLPDNLDVLVMDSYDEKMYSFVPDHDDRLKEMRDRAGKMDLAFTYRLPVYQDDKYFNENWDELILLNGSWFFRNSCGYEIKVYYKR